VGLEACGGGRHTCQFAFVKATFVNQSAVLTSSFSSSKISKSKTFPLENSTTGV